MAHIVFLRTAAADLTAGKPPLKGVPASAPLSAAAAAIPESQEAAVAVWRDGAAAASVVVGLLSSLDVVAFLASHVGGPAAALRTPAGDVVAHQPALVREVEPHARLIEIVELMKQGALRVLVRKNITEASTVEKKPFAPFFKAVLKITGTPRASARERRDSSGGSPPPTFACDRYCCLTREDIVRFLINCLGALAPVPMQSLSDLGAVDRGSYAVVEASSPAVEAACRGVPDEPRAVAVVRTRRDGSRAILADVSAHRLWRRDYVAAADAMATLSALDFAAAGVDGCSRTSASHSGNAALTCRTTSSLAAVMAQMLSYRATHVWVTEGDDDDDDVLVGVVGYMEVFKAVTMGVTPPA